MQTPAFQHTACSLTPSASTAETCSAFLRPPHLQQVLQWVRSKRNWFCSGRAEGTRVLPWSEQSNETWGTGERNRRLFPLSSPSFQESRITSVPRWSTQRSHPLREQTGFRGKDSGARAPGSPRDRAAGPLRAPGTPLSPDSTARKEAAAALAAHRASRRAREELRRHRSVSVHPAEGEAAGGCCAGHRQVWTGP